MRSLLLAPLPALLVASLAVVASLPWGGPDSLELALALMPIAAVHYWSTRRPWLLPPPIVFLLGLFADVVTHEPLGAWTSAALMAALAGRLQRLARGEASAIGRFVHAAGTLALAVCLVAAVTSFHSWKLVAWVPLLAGCLAYPVLSGILSAIDGLWPVAEERSLLLRGD